MDCAAFFELVADRLGDHSVEPTRTATGGQCVVDFFHPRTEERLGTDGLATRFNRSGVVWVPDADRLGVRLRVPATHGDAIAEALAGAPFPFDRTDHRGVVTPDGEVVTVLHVSLRTDDVARGDLEATLDAVARALSV